MSDISGPGSCHPHPPAVRHEIILSHVYKLHLLVSSFPGKQTPRHTASEIHIPPAIGSIQIHSVSVIHLKISDKKEDEGEDEEVVVVLVAVPVAVPVRDIDERLDIRDNIS